MHPHIQQRVDVLNALHQRSVMATADFYRLANVARPVQPPRFKVEPTGMHMFHVIDRITGKVKGWRREHLEACRLADSLARTVAA
jgi:hypothetical protein